MFPLLLALLLSTPQVHPVEREVYLMGTTLRITLYSADREEGFAQIEEAFRIVEDAEHQMSTWTPESEVSKLNRAALGSSFQLSPSLCELLMKVEEQVRFTEGAFDPAAGRIIEAWQIHGTGKIPESKTLEIALANSGFSKLQIQQCAAVKRADLLIDVGAFGKGEALDRVVDVAKQKKFGPMLLDFGGQLLAWKSPPAQKSWKVSLASPLNRHTSSGIEFPLRSGSLSTSSGSERDLILGGQRIGHIVDPRTGRPVPSFGSVTVWARTAFGADALSTALYVMGPEQGFRWAIKNQIAACFLIIHGETFQVLQTPEFETLVK